MAHENEVFICYETLTGLINAKHLKKALKKWRRSSFVASEDIEAGEPEQDVRENAIKNCRYFVVVVTRLALESDPVKQEINSAQRYDKKIIICKDREVDEALLSELPIRRQLQYIEFGTMEDLANNVIEEIAKIETLQKRNSERKMTFDGSRTQIKSFDKLAEKQFEVRDIIYEGNVIPYIEFESNEGHEHECTLYTKVYNDFFERAYYLEAHFNQVPINKLKEILLIYYNTFVNYEHYHSAFSITQSGLSWIGYGANNFVKALQNQSLRYSQIKKKYGDETYIHHNESACFIDEIGETIFYIDTQPKSSSNLNELTLDFFSIGFIFKDIPFNTIYNEFFNKIQNVPESLKEVNGGLTQRFPLKEFTFKEEGFITTNYRDERYVSGLYGEIPIELKNNEIINRHNKIIVNLRDYHDTKQKRKHSIYGVKITQIPSGSYILDITGTWL
ncbi:MAG: toll/interleukin-1 receptor domain-containing protein [Candidatus Methanoperedens sp.]|nr:toll/interleukin-1 receptor domain-containing protein [Candidatus Methanoperedens sp.]MCZ7383637.1 toll/interleukin-1 receptor domain-containing protein [Candidatus Methanoperedens sp.]MCZ7405100.1 toll/interleukin-1 receptor domain-containing protein [Candidatus Methanoperedens sp.]